MGLKTLFKRGLNAPELYRPETSKIKKNNMRNAIDSDAANYMVQETQSKAKEA